MLDRASSCEFKNPLSDWPLSLSSPFGGGFFQLRKEIRRLLLHADKRVHPFLSRSKVSIDWSSAINSNSTVSTVPVDRVVSNVGSKVCPDQSQPCSSSGGANSAGKRIIITRLPVVVVVVTPSCIPDARRPKQKHVPSGECGREWRLEVTAQLEAPSSYHMWTVGKLLVEQYTVIAKTLNLFH